MKQVYRNKVYTRRKCINSIVRFYNESNQLELTNGSNWYQEANNLAKEYSLKTGYSVLNIAGVIAALSPQTSWEQNKAFLARFIDKGMNSVTNTYANKLKAEKCLKASNSEEIQRILNGNKTKAFFLNIAYPNVDNIATIDRHAMAICIQFPDKVKAIEHPVQLTLSQYKFFESCYIEASNRLNILTSELQAVTWVTYRRLRNLK